MALPDGGELPSYQDINIRHAGTCITEFLPGNTLFKREREEEGGLGKTEGVMTE